VLFSLQNEGIKCLEVTFGANARRHWDVCAGAGGINRRARRIAATVPAALTALTALTHIVLLIVAAATSDLARAAARTAARTAALARRTAALAPTPGTTKLLVIGVVERDRGVNTAGPGRVSIAARKRGLLRWGLN
jgi:hypothetical protein